jgi:hypothetical protein
VCLGSERLEFVPGGLVDLRADLDAVHGQSMIDKARNVKTSGIKACMFGNPQEIASGLLRVTVLHGYASLCNLCARNTS